MTREGEKGQDGVRVAIEDKLGQVHDRKKEAHNQKPSDIVPDLLLKETPEINLLRKGSAKDLEKHGAHGGRGKRSSGLRKEEPERQEDYGRNSDTGNDILRVKPKIHPFPQHVRDHDENKGNQVSQGRKRKGMIQKHQAEYCRICSDCLSDLQPIGVVSRLSLPPHKCDVYQG
jgi:hypothetical protein